ncbi:RICIN domain-containing protein [Neisseria iguanae]|nr:RICIN domain-containing protein [Neisseria iguanae]
MIDDDFYGIYTVHHKQIDNIKTIGNTAIRTQNIYTSERIGTSQTRDHYMSLPHLIQVHGECVDVSGNDGKTVIRYPCHGKANQRFVFKSSGEIWQGNKCLDVANGKNVIMYACHGKDNQLWYRHGLRIISVSANKCLDASSKILQVKPCNNSPSQQFRF